MALVKIGDGGITAAPPGSPTVGQTLDWNYQLGGSAPPPAPDPLSLQLNGTDEFAQGPNMNAIFGAGAMTQISISIWAKKNGTWDGFKSMFGSSINDSWAAGFGLFFNGSAANFWVNSYTNAVSFNYSASTYDHWLCVWDKTGSNLFKVYINGSLAGTLNAASNTDLTPLARPVSFGTVSLDVGYNLPGYFRQFAAWNTALTAADAVTLYNGGVAANKALTIAAANLKVFIPITSDDNAVSAGGLLDTSGNLQNFSGKNTDASNLVSTPIV